MQLKQVPLKVCPLPLEAHGDRCVLRRVLLGVRIVGGAACGRHRVSAGDVGSGRAEHSPPSPVSVPYPADSCLVLTTENVLRVSFRVCFLAHRTGFLSATIVVFCSRLSPDWVSFGFNPRNHLVKHLDSN